ncbi:hypothetical protein R1flu_016997 [Riccia fluitans]|uniref:2,4-dienoyl-CoA reductase [(3E)-enoyl-CoA-producing] n=1 Tax=Riccia fluitans TaxID=41844 RepID=A0ABD1YNG2_9MARC
MDIDTLGTCQMSFAALHYLKKGGKGKQPDEGGVILNISATLHYTASWYQIHAAVDSITRSLALEWGTDFRIRVNGIAPGPIKNTPGMAKLSVDFDEKIAKNIPLVRYGDKSDIANCTLFICSEEGLNLVLLSK